jgi:hypothetical protein
MQGIARELRRRGALEASVPSLTEASMTFLLPAEHLDGTDAEQRQLRSLLTRLRTGPQPAPLPHFTCQALPDVLASGLADRSLFNTGYKLLSQRYAALGMPVLLPLSRVQVGVSSSAPPGHPASFGGFHHPGQGYRHLQMTATITTYGQLTGTASATPQAVAFDLVRSYAHDCLHYGTCRRYRLTPDGQIARVQYGINFRSLDGGTYSAPDPPDAIATRNLGIVMESARNHRHGRPGRCRPVRLRGHDRDTHRNRDRGRQGCRSSVPACPGRLQLRGDRTVPGAAAPTR